MERCDHLNEPKINTTGLALEISASLALFFNRIPPYNEAKFKEQEERK